MFPRPLSLLKAAAVIALLALQGCISIQAIEPVIEPPQVFQGDITVPVEFAPPGAVGFRCAERGAKFLGLPGINSGACADRLLVTMVDPCRTLTAGPYAEALCQGLAWRDEEAPPAASTRIPLSRSPSPLLVKAAFGRPPARDIKPTAAQPAGLPQTLVSFVAPASLEMSCAERGAVMFNAGHGLLACADRLMVTVANPCDFEGSSWYARTLCHELAHANGWPADHPTGAHVRGPFAKASESPQAKALAAAQMKSEVQLAAQTDATPQPALVTRPADLTATQKAAAASAVLAMSKVLKLESVVAFSRSLRDTLGVSRLAFLRTVGALDSAGDHLTTSHADAPAPPSRDIAMTGASLLESASGKAHLRR